MTELSDFYWLAFPIWHDRAEAEAIFVKRFGRLPERVITVDHSLWYGPIGPVPTKDTCNREEVVV